MKPILIAGSGIVSLALIAYSIGIISEQKKRALTWNILIFLGAGLLFDISGTLCMIIGSKNSPFTFHGIIGYTALLGMLVDNVLFWRLASKNGLSAQVTNALHIYSKIAYIWWVFVYASGIVRSMYMQ
jgi:uncharacterized repeat protein (TIGR03987 family)